MPTKSKTTKTTAPKSRKPTTAKAAPKTRKITKRQQIIEMLRRPEGATLDEMIAATAWQGHTARAVVSGIRNGKHGNQIFDPLPVIREEYDGRSRWRIAESTD